MKFNPSLILLSIGASAVMAAPPQAKRCDCSASVSDKLIFTDSMSSFQSSRNAKDPSCCAWDSDNCSSSPDRPVGLDFVPSCQRHDFGYRNGKDQNRFTEAYRERVDNKFQDDLHDYCNQFDGFKGFSCRGIANIYHAAVRRCGDGNCLDSVEQEEIQKLAKSFEEK